MTIHKLRDRSGSTEAKLSNIDGQIAGAPLTNMD